MTEDPEVLAARLAQHLAALREEADGAGLSTLSYLLTLAEAEASDTANGKRWLDIVRPMDAKRRN